jgi:hypothetical protein
MIADKRGEVSLDRTDDSVKPPPQELAARRPIDGEFFPLQLRIAQRADDLARTEPGHAHAGPGRRLWIKAEREIVGAASRVALADLLSLCRHFSRKYQ